MAAQVSDFDRFSFTLFLALVLHAIIALGITFAPEDPRSSAQTMEITLSQFDDETEPDKADFLAQTNQKGSGTKEEPVEMTSPNPSEVNQKNIEPVQPEPASRTEPVAREEKAVVQTQAETERSSPQPEKAEPDVDEPLPVREKKSLMERSLEIASLEARFDRQQRAYARKPRVMRVTAASTLKSTNALYVSNWVDRVVRVGNINYPSEARQKNLYGNARILVSLRKDGTVKELAILESSGSPVLDDAVKRIVRMAAPFPPFPDSLKETADELEIIRTWVFGRQGLSSG
ncbi:energy transducer TonB [Marinobacter sp. CHS3-4]|uniref:energy transducer TonB n=1 Tax=Marinobacter sp. CHS3-4 TaxID=3045174 RepID=UPI0024B61AB5|nr:energy transducer TonB [Marinobacter sp. CHS3-4]MDI9243943.1 energy transducer TonB [Marinobacter sp. CHS3-4]